MSLTKQSQLWKMVADDRVPSLLKSNRTRKARAKLKTKEKKSKTFDTQKLYSPYEDHNGPLAEDQVEHVMLQKKKRELGQNPARRKHQAKDRNHGMERAPAKERSRSKRKARPNHKHRRARSKERNLERASMRRVNLPKRRERAKAKARKVSQVENPAKIGKVHVETAPVIQTREIHTLFRAPCGSTCHTPFVQLSPMASRLFVASHVEVGAQAEFTSGPHRGPSFGWSDCKIRNTVPEAENHQIWAVFLKPFATLRISWDGGWNLARIRWWTSVQCLATHRKIQKWNKSFDFPGTWNAVYRSDRESESPKTEAPRKTLQPKRTWTHTVGTQTDEWPRTDSDPRVTKTLALHWWNWAMYLPFIKTFGRERDTTKSPCTTSIRWVCRSPYDEIRERPWGDPGAQERTPPRQLEFRNGRGNRAVADKLKTHEPPGQVKPRAIHSSTKNPLVPLGK